MAAASDWRIREINPHSRAEIELVASRMRDTLVEVLGEQQGGGMYTMDWLIKRVEFHLDPAQCTGMVLLAEMTDVGGSDSGNGGIGGVVGHTIVRIEPGEDGGGEFGLFSTFYVAPQSRGRGIATAFVHRGEQWMREQGMKTAMTYTAEDNAGLKNLMVGLGYRIVLTKNRMVALARDL